jgi:polyphosphate kinase 2
MGKGGKNGGRRKGRRTTSTVLAAPERDRISRKEFDAELERLQVELIKLQGWISANGLRVVVLFEGRDSAGKGGMIKRITEHLNPRMVHTVALPKPNDRERGQWYFQRYIEHLPGAGEMVLFDRSWYNRAGVEAVMGFCTPTELDEFLRSCPSFERMLIDSGIRLVKYWLEVGADSQMKRFKDRIDRPTKRWKISPMDAAAREHFYDYSRARDVMFAHTDTPDSPWFIVPSDDQRRARLNCITHLLTMIPYEEILPKPVKLPPLQDPGDYVESPLTARRVVPQIF